METKKFKVFNIKWDLDEPEDINCVPNEMIVDISNKEIDNLNNEEEIEDYISDFISDEIGFCNDGFDYIEIIP